jgi:hypothetical protein
MNKFVGVLLLAASVSAQAAFQYEVVVRPSTTWAPGVSVYGNEYFIRVTEGSGSLYLLDHINNLYSANQSESVLNNVSAFGYINLTTGESGTGSFSDTITTYDQAMSEWNDTVTQTGYSLGTTFSAGDEIAIWVTDSATGYTGATAGQSDSAYVDGEESWRTWGSETDILGNTAGLISFSGGSAIFFGITGVEGAGGSTTGQPLPGVLSCLLISGAIGIIKLRSSKKAARV